MDKIAPSWDDAYDILDGGINHVVLIGALHEKTSIHRLYSAQSIRSPFSTLHYHDGD